MRSVLLVCNLRSEKFGALERYLAACAAHGRATGVRVAALLAGEPVPPAAEAFRAAGLEWWVEPNWVNAADVEDPRAFVRATVRTLRAGPWDVVVFQFCSELGVVRAMAAARARGLSPGGTVWVQHSQMSPPGRLARVASRFRLLRLAVGRVIVLSDAARRAVVGRGWPAEKVSVIRNGLPPLPPGRRGWLRPALGLPADALVILCVASLIRRKGLDVLLPAVAPLLGTDPPRCLVVAGDGPDRADLEALAVRLGIADHVRWLGLRDDVPDILADADLFALASRAEGLTLAVIEAMAFGLPVVVTDVGGHREVVPPDAGRIVPPGDEKALAEALRAAVASHPADRAAAEARRAIVAAEFSLNAQVREQFGVFAASAGVRE